MEAEVTIQSVCFKAFVDRRTGDMDDNIIAVGIYLEEFLKEVEKLPLTETGFLNFTIKRLFRPTQKGLTHKMYFTYTDVPRHKKLTVLKKTNLVNGDD